MGNSISQNSDTQINHELVKEQFSQFLDSVNEKDMSIVNLAREWETYRNNLHNNVKLSSKENSIKLEIYLSLLDKLFDEALNKAYESSNHKISV